MIIGWQRFLFLLLLLQQVPPVLHSVIAVVLAVSFQTGSKLFKKKIISQLEQ